MRCEGKGVTLEAHTTKTADQCHPGSRKRRNVNTIAHIVLKVIEIHQRRLAKVVVGQLELAHLCRDDCLRTCRQRGVSHGKWLVIGKVAGLLLGSKRIAKKLHRQDKISLLNDLFAIEIKVWEVQEKGILIWRCAFKVPYLVPGKRFVLRMYSKSLIKWNKHLF